MADVSDNRLGALISSRRKSVVPPMSQAELGRHIGLDQRSVSTLESGRQKTISPDVANKIPGVLPITMAELVRAMEYDLPEARTKLPEGLLRDLEAAPPEILQAVQLVLGGWRAEQQARQRRVAS